jgi:hypothetical protein
LNRIALSARFEIRYYVVENWEEAIEAVRTGKADLIPGISITEKRKSEFLFSREFETVPISCFIRAENYSIGSASDLAGRRVGLLADDALTSHVENLPDTELQPFQNIDMALGRLLSGELDAFIFPEPIMQHKLRLMRISDRVKAAGPPLMERKRAFLFSRENQALLDLINPILSEYVQSDVYVQDYQKWYGKPQPFWTAKRIFLFMSVILALSLALSFSWRYYQVNSLNRKMLHTMRDRDMAQKELAKARALLESAIEQTPSASHRRWPSSRFVISTGSFAYSVCIHRGSHSPSRRSCHRPDFPLSHGTPCPRKTPLSAPSFAEKRPGSDLILRRREGSERRIMVNASPIQDHEKVVTAGIIVFQTSPIAFWPNRAHGIAE